MSDFIYSSTPRTNGELGGYLQSIYHADAPEVHEYHGPWGALAVTRNLYQGFQPVETDDHVFVVIGGPVLYFTDNRFLTGDDPVAGTRSILERFAGGAMQWDEDLSGPFVILSVDKLRQTVTCITDLMMFIPVYSYMEQDGLVLGTHVDAVAKAAHQQQAFDPVSLADFIINHSVTFPYTTYEKLRQLHPAALQVFSPGHSDYREQKAGAAQENGNAAVPNGISTSGPEYYWIPEESNNHGTIREAAQVLRSGVRGYVDTVCAGMDEVAQFISAGEDSRVIAGMLPEKLARDGFVFLDHMNREGRIASKVSGVYGLHFIPQFREKTHYLDILPEASHLIGSGSQHIHAHTLGFHRKCKLDRYPAVFGGYSADVFLKGYYLGGKKSREKSSSLPGAPTVKVNRDKADIRWQISGPIRKEVSARRNCHRLHVQKYRPDTYQEWAKFWPASIRVALPNLGTNRRLFRTYEPFLCKETVKMCASAPIKWKQKERLYRKAMHPFMEKSRWLIHQDGHFPYFPWWINCVPQMILSIWRVRKKFLRPSPVTAHEGPWGNWKTTMETEEWKAWVDASGTHHPVLRSLFQTSPHELISRGQLHRKQVVNLFQVIQLLTDEKTPEIVE